MRNQQPAHCPAPEELSAFLADSLPGRRDEAIALHLDTCALCQTAVEKLEAIDVELLSGIRLAMSTPPLVDEHECRRVVARIQAIAASDSDAPAATCGQAAAARPARLGGYELGAKLGEGGMGTVYKARQPSLDRWVAVKVLPAGRLGDARAVARFQREIKAAGKLKHPNIVTAHDAGEAGGTHYLVMEYVEGCDLSSLVRRCGPLAVADACEIVRQAALGLQHAHEHGLVHRDVKPSNLMLTTAEPSSVGQVKLLDLGLARLAGLPPADELTAANQMLGTVDYMAPEQAGDSHAVDIRADVYSLGCTLYKLLAGEAPFSGPRYATTVKKMMAHEHHPVPPISQRRNDLPAALIAVLAGMLAKKPADRYATPSQVAAAMAPFAAGSDLARLAARFAAESHGGAAAPAAITPHAMSDALSATCPSKSPATVDTGERHDRRFAPITAMARYAPWIGRAIPKRALAILPRARRRVVLAISGAFVFLAAVVVYVGAGNGTVRIEVNDPAIGVIVDGTNVTIEGVSAKPLTLRRGAHGLAVKYRDLDFETDDFIVRRGDTVTLRVQRLRAKVRAVIEGAHGETVLGERPLPEVTPIDPEPVVGATPVDRRPAGESVANQPGQPSGTNQYHDAIELTVGGKSLRVGDHAVTRLVDWDDDGKLDLLVGTGDGYIWHFRNVGSPTDFRLAPGEHVKDGNTELRAGTGYTTACFVDMTGDAKSDLIVAHSDNQVRLCVNKGTAAAPLFNGSRAFAGPNAGEFRLPSNCGARIDVGDWDGDENPDIVAGGFDGYIWLYRNTGTGGLPRFEDAALELKYRKDNGKRFRNSYNVHPTIIDLTQDGLPDLAYGINWGLVELFLSDSQSQSTFTFQVLHLAMTVKAGREGGRVNLRAVAGDDTTPTFGDVNGDGTLDMISGGSLGKLWLLLGGRPAPVPSTPIGPEPVVDATPVDRRKQFLNLTYDGHWRDAGDGVWLNVSNKTGVVNCKERETERTNEYIEVFCPNRNYHLRFFSNRVELKRPGGQWGWVANGRWDTSNLAGGR